MRDDLPLEAASTLRSFLGIADLDVAAYGHEAVEMLCVADVCVLAQALGAASLEAGSLVLRTANGRSLLQVTELVRLFRRFPEDSRLPELLVLAEHDLSALLDGLGAWSAADVRRVIDAWLEGSLSAAELARLVCEERARGSHLWACDLCRIKRLAAGEFALLLQQEDAEVSVSKPGDVLGDVLYRSPYDEPFGMRLPSEITERFENDATLEQQDHNQTAAAPGVLTYAGRDVDLRRLCKMCVAEVRRFVTIMGNDTEIWHTGGRKRRDVLTALRALERFKARWMHLEQVARDASSVLRACCDANRALQRHELMQARQAPALEAAAAAEAAAIAECDAIAAAVAAGEGASRKIDSNAHRAQEEALHTKAALAGLKLERRYAQADGDPASRTRRSALSALPANLLADGTPVTAHGVTEVLKLAPAVELPSAAREAELRRSWQTSAHDADARLGLRVVNRTRQQQRAADDAASERAAAWKKQAVDIAEKVEQRRQVKMAAAARAAEARRRAREAQRQQSEALRAEAGRRAAAAAARARERELARQKEMLREVAESRAMQREEILQRGEGDRYWGIPNEAARLRALEMQRQEDWERRIRRGRRELATMGCTRAVGFVAPQLPPEPRFAVRLAVLARM